MGQELSCCSAGIPNQIESHTIQIQQPMNKIQPIESKPYLHKKYNLIKLYKVQCDPIYENAYNSQTDLNQSKIDTNRNRNTYSFNYSAYSSVAQSNAMKQSHISLSDPQTFSSPRTIPIQILYHPPLKSPLPESHTNSKKSQCNILQNSFVKDKQTSQSESNFINFASTMESLPIKSWNQTNSSQLNNNSIHEQDKIQLIYSSKLFDSVLQPQEVLSKVEEMYQDGSSYSGQKLNQKKHGMGSFKYSNNSKYEGQWKEDKMNGQGLLYYPNGYLAYRGQFKDNQFWGEGYLQNMQINYSLSQYDDANYYQDLNSISEMWLSYEGTFENDQRHGKGKLILQNGDSIEGNFSYGLVNGEATLFKQKQEFLKGIWKNNIFIQNMSNY